MDWSLTSLPNLAGGGCSMIAKSDTQSFTPSTELNADVSQMAIMVPVRQPRSGKSMGAGRHTPSAVPAAPRTATFLRDALADRPAEARAMTG